MESSPIEILIVDSDPAQAQITMAMLTKSRKKEFSVQHVRNLADGLSLLRNENFKVILVDVDLPDSQGLETAVAVRNHTRQSAIIAIIGLDDEDIAQEALQSQIHDYLIRGEITDGLLQRSMRCALQRQRDIEAQRQCEQCFYSFMHHLPVAAWMKDPLGRYIQGNTEHQRIFSMPLSEYSGKTDEEFLPLETARRLRENDERVASTGETLQTTEGLLLPDGTERLFAVSKFPVPGPDGRTAYVGGIAMDITERKLAEEAIRKSEKKFAKVFQETPALLAISSLKDGSFVDVNKAMVQTLGFQRDELIGASALDLNLWEDLSDRSAILKTLEDTGSAKNFEVRIRGKNNQSHICLFSAEYIYVNGDRYMLSLVEDITDRKLMEESLRQREETLRLFVEHLPASIVMVDKEMNYVYASRRWFESLGVEDLDVRGRSHYELFPDIPGRWKEVHRRCLAGATERNEADLWERANGTSAWFKWEITPWYKGQNEIGGLVIFAEDITERKQMDQEIERLNAEVAARAVELVEANRELEAFNYTVAHDLRNPLNLIHGYSQIIMRLCGGQMDDECRGYLQQSTDAVLRMNKLISALLEFSRTARAELHPQTFDISAVAHAVVAELRQSESERRLDFRICDGIVVEGDPDLLRVVLDNLLRNAWKYTAGRDEAVIEFGVAEHNGEAACFVRDNGPGFDMADAGKLFIPFQRLAATAELKGFGIGLATVERIIRRHGGRIWAEGEPGKGATFWFTLPNK